jgi:thiamine-phosphate pyrophosphorylase
MMLCLVTDRHRLAGGATFETERERLVEQARRARDDVDLLQIRERDLPARRLATLVEDFVAVCRGRRARVVVNDRLDVALACAAAGVHLRHDSMPAADVRRIAPARFLVGRSVSSVATARAAGPVDYLIAGSIFPTASKAAAHRLLGLQGLAEIVHAVPVPVLAIGGIDADNVDEVAATGAAGVAAIGWFIERFDVHDTPS